MKDKKTHDRPISEQRTLRPKPVRIQEQDDQSARLPTEPYSKERLLAKNQYFFRVANRGEQGSSAVGEGLHLGEEGEESKEEVEYQDFQELWFQVCMKESELGKKYLLTKQTLRNIIKKASNDGIIKIVRTPVARPEPLPDSDRKEAAHTKQELRKSQLQNIQLTEKIKAMNFMLRQLKARRPEEVLGRLQAAEGEWKQRMRQSYEQKERVLREQLERGKDESRQLFQQLQTLKLEYFNSKRKLIKMEQFINFNSMMEYDTGSKVINFEKINSLVEELFQLREEYSQNALSIQQLTEEAVALRLEALKLKEQLREVQMLHQQACQVAAQVPQLEASIRDLEAVVRQGEFEREQQVQLIRVAQQQSAQSAAEVEQLNQQIKALREDYRLLYREKNNLVKELERVEKEFNRRVFEEDKSRERVQQFIKQLEEVRVKKTTGLKAKFRALEGAHKLPAEEVERLYREKVEYVLYLSNVESRLKDQLIFELKAQVSIVLRDNQSLRSNASDLERRAFALEGKGRRLVGHVNYAISEIAHKIKDKACPSCLETKQALINYLRHEE